MPPAAVSTDDLIAATNLSVLLTGETELALLDVREPGQFGEGHIFAAVPLAYSRLELDFGSLVPRVATPIVLCDAGDGIALRARSRLVSLGYQNVKVLAGGIDGWRAAGFRTFVGVNVPSKVFGELVERRYETPHISPERLDELRKRADHNIVVVDGRPLEEFQRMHIPGAICCPNGELALRINQIVPDANTTVVVNCAGRTRSILGAQTLINCGVPNPIFALENGTQGWFLAGYDLIRAQEGRLPRAPARAQVAELRERMAILPWWREVPLISAAQVSSWCDRAERTTYIFDVRTREEYKQRTVTGAVHAPGGQLIQATDQWIGVRNARIVVVDADDVRATPMAHWLRQMGHDAYVLEGGVDAPVNCNLAAPQPTLRDLTSVDYQLCAGMRLIDVRASAEYRRGHAPGSVWSTRARILSAAGSCREVGLIANDARVAALAAIDLEEAGIAARQITNAPLTETSPNVPPDSERIDFVFFASKRHEGDADAARQYLAWETGLIAELSAAELNTFRIRASC